ncbi:trigalactosyldiacylglycerol2 [Perilla frutescens var. frutescens]|nr:trigalactosyldiacylglycerol2 [Perilla frutescens var. frutescens]
METSTLRFVSTSPVLLRSYLGNGALSSLPCLTVPLRLKNKKPLIVKAISSTDTGHINVNASSSKSKSLFSLVLDVPWAIWKQTLRPLGDFGFGRKSIWEGGVGLFLVSGAFLLAFSLAWLRGFQLRSKFKIEDDKIIIPQNSVVEVNQSGLLMETLIDITPRDPIPAASVGPLHAGCAGEGLIVCDRQKIKGHQGVSLDALVGIFTRTGHEVKGIGVANTFSLAERIAAVIVDARPLLTKVRFDVVISQIQALAEDLEPLLAEVHDSGLLKEVENLTKSLTRAFKDLR